MCIYSSVNMFAAVFREAYLTAEAGVDLFL